MVLPGWCSRRLQRLVRPAGLFLFHVNALEDRPLRARWQPARELEPDYVAEESGQTVHFFSEAYLRELLRDGGSCIWARSRSAARDE